MESDIISSTKGRNDTNNDCNSKNAKFPDASGDSKVCTSSIHGLYLSGATCVGTSSLAITKADDILPSYQMHQDVFNRADTIAKTEKVPKYRLQSDGDMSIALDQEENAIAKANLTNNILDNIHNLPVVEKRKISIQFHLNPNPRKYYTTGDIVSGYVIIHNSYDVDVPFEMFYLSLEGNSKVDTMSLDMAGIEFNSKYFLRALDLGGSWTETEDPVQNAWGNGANNEQLGLPRERILKAGCKYQKYFVFRLPRTPLDTVCIDGVQKHLLLPPSIGTNDIMYPPKGITQDHTQIEQTFSERDFSSPTSSINYTVNARLVVSDLARKHHIILSFQRVLFRFVPTLAKEIQFLVRLEFSLSPDKSLELLTRIILHDLELLSREGSGQEADDDRKRANLYRPRVLPPSSDCKISFNLISRSKSQSSEKRWAPVDRVDIVNESNLNVNFQQIFRSKGSLSVPFKLRYLYSPAAIPSEQVDKILPTSMKAELHYINIDLKGVPIPIELNPLWFTSKLRFHQKVTSTFAALKKKLESLPNGTELHATTLQKMRAMERLRFDSGIVSNFVDKVIVCRKETQLLVDEGRSYYCFDTLFELSLQIETKNLRKMILVPDFQECLTSRLYFVRVKFKLNPAIQVQYDESTGDILNQFTERHYKLFIDIPLSIKN